jgi:hypothetical protein
MTADKVTARLARKIWYSVRARLWRLWYRLWGVECECNDATGWMVSVGSKTGTITISLCRRVELILRREQSQTTAGYSR